MAHPSDSWIMLHLYPQAGDSALLGRSPEPSLVNLDNVESITPRRIVPPDGEAIDFTRIQFVDGKMHACAETVHDIAERLFPAADAE